MYLLFKSFLQGIQNCKYGKKDKSNKQKRNCI